MMIFKNSKILSRQHLNFEPMQRFLRGSGCWFDPQKNVAARRWKNRRSKSARFGRSFPFPCFQLSGRNRRRIRCGLQRDLGI